MGASEERRVDEKGRITIPRAIRESLQIDPGEEVAVELEGDRIVIHPRISRTDLVETLGGCVNEDTRDADAKPTDPDDLEADWTSDLPDP
jgi:AbrB family looped-hinge helix DNA binding protein